MNSFVFSAYVFVSLLLQCVLVYCWMTQRSINRIQNEINKAMADHMKEVAETFQYIAKVIQPKKKETEDDLVVVSERPGDVVKKDK